MTYIPREPLVLGNGPLRRCTICSMSRPCSKASATLWYWASRDGWVSFPGTQEAFSSSGRELWAGAKGCHRLLGATPQGRECPVTQDGAQTASVGRAKLTVTHTLLSSLLQGRQRQGPGATGSLLEGHNTTQHGCREIQPRTRASDTDAHRVTAFDRIPSLPYLRSRVLQPTLLSSDYLMGFTIPSSSFPKVFHLRDVMGCGVKRH